MEQMIDFKRSLGPELWVMVLAFLSGAAARAAKRGAPKALVPYVSLLAGCVLSVTWALLAEESLPGAFALGLTAGGMAVGGHELAKKFLGRYLGDALAEKILGVGVVGKK